MTDIAPDWILWGVGILIGISLIAWSLFKFGPFSKSNYAYLEVQRKSRLLNPSERSFYDCLAEALDERYSVLVKVRANDVIEAHPGAGRQNKKRIVDELAGQYFDYVLCNKADMSIFGAITLENFDADGKRKSRKNKKSLLLSEACDRANIKLFYFDLRQDYEKMDLSRLITGQSKSARAKEAKEAEESGTHRSNLSIEPNSQSISGYVRSCPKCNSEVVTKVAVKGSQIGEKFLMCRKYPYCDYKISSSDISLAEQKRSEQKRSRAAGYKNWT